MMVKTFQKVIEKIFYNELSIGSYPDNLQL